MKKIAIIGAGISGLFIANLFKKNSDYQVVIYEKSNSINLDEGYGIQLSVNSIKLLNKFGFKKLSASEVNYPSKVNFIQSKNSKKIADGDGKSQGSNKFIIDNNIEINLRGIAGKLEEAKSSLSKNFIYALLISFFLLSSLFQSFIYPLIVLTIVPLSSLAGIYGLKIMNIFSYEPLNMLSLSLIHI